MQWIFYLLLAILLAGSVYTDLRWRKIKNVLVFPVIILGLTLHAFFDGGPGFLFSFKGMVVGFLMLYLPSWIIGGGLGAGDIKLMAAIGTLVGPEIAMWSALCASLTGAVMGIVINMREGRLSEMKAVTVRHTFYIVEKFIRRDFTKVPLATAETGTTIAYAVPITMGVLIVELLEVVII